MKEAESKLAESRAQNETAAIATEPVAEASIDDAQNVEEIKPRRKKKRGRPTKISAIDETLDETEWLVATPPKGAVTKAVSIASDSDFGYQEPPRKQPPVNDAQMSLF